MAAPTPMVFRPVKGVYPPIPVDIAAFDAFDDVNGMTFHPTGKEILVLYNPTVGAITYTVASAADPLEGRLDTTLTAYNIPASGASITGPWSSLGWAAVGVIGVTCSATGLLYLLTAASN